MDGRIKIRHLQAFAAICRHASFRDAARQLYLTQPAISRTMAELEDILGCRLLNRDRGGVTQTPQGAFFLSFAEASLAALDRGVSGIAAFVREPGPHLRLGAEPCLAAGAMPAVLRALATEAPDLRLTLVEAPHADLIARLRDRQLDLVAGLQGAPETMADLAFTQLGTETLAIATAPGHPLEARPLLRDAIAHSVIYPPPEDPMRPALRRLLVGAGLPLPALRVETGSGGFGLARVLAGDAVWFAPASQIRAWAGRGLLTVLPIDTTGTETPAGLIARAGEDASPAERLILPALRRHLGSRAFRV